MPNNTFWSDACKLAESRPLPTLINAAHASCGVTVRWARAVAAAAAASAAASFAATIAIDVAAPVDVAGCFLSF
jgi:hypothetical protein